MFRNLEARSSTQIADAKANTYPPFSQLKKPPSGRFGTPARRSRPGIWARWRMPWVIPLRNRRAIRFPPRRWIVVPTRRRRRRSRRRAIVLMARTRRSRADRGFLQCFRGRCRRGTFTFAGRLLVLSDHDNCARVSPSNTALTPRMPGTLPWVACARIHAFCPTPKRPRLPDTPLKGLSKCHSVAPNRYDILTLRHNVLVVYSKGLTSQNVL